MDFIWGDDLISIGIIVALNILILIAYFELRFFTLKRKIFKINVTIEEHYKKLKDIESKFVHKINKEMKAKEKSREKKLLKLKNEIEEMVREGKK